VSVIGAWQAAVRRFLVAKGLLVPKDKANGFVRWVEWFLQTAAVQANGMVLA